MLSPEEVSSAKAEPTTSIQTPSPEPEDPEEGYQPSNLPYFEDHFFENFRDTSRYSCQKKPVVLVTPLEPIDKEFLRESIKELIAILSREWVADAEFSSKEIQIHTPSSTIHCKIWGIWVDVFYNPSIGANLMSTTFASSYLDEKPLAPIVKSHRSSPRTSQKGVGILHDTILHHGDIEVALDFHVFEI